MIKQKRITIKTASATLNYGEMGDLVCNSADPITITLPESNIGLWYRVSNVGAGIVTISYDSSELTTLKQTEQCLCLANGSDGWFFSKGGVSTFTALTDAPSSYTDMAGKVVKVNSTEDGLEFDDENPYTLPQATETTLGGIKAKAKTAESAEVKIDIETGKLYAPAPDAATNGIPEGGTAGQVLSKVDGDNYNAQWVDPDAESILTKPVTIPYFTGKDGYVLAYDETNDEFYLKADEGGGGGGEHYISFSGVSGITNLGDLLFNTNADMPIEPLNLIL